MGFFLWKPDLKLHGIRILPIKATTTTVELRNEPVIQPNYPFAESIVLYIHEDASEVLKQFVEFCQSEQGARIAEKYGLVTPWHEMEYEGQQRLKAHKAGRSPRILSMGLRRGQKLLQDLVLDYVKEVM